MTPHADGPLDQASGADHAHTHDHDHSPSGGQHVHDGAFSSGHQHGVRPGEAEWDARYGERTEGIWSGAPNHALVTEVSALPPGRVLDVGCGEGADAVWLARQGWQVVGLEPSGVALERARSAADAAGVDIRWVHGQLHEVEDDLDAASFDLVSVFYPALYTDTEPVAALTRLVAPGGSLLVVHHADVDPELARSHGFELDELLAPADVVAQVPDGWTVAVDERRERLISGGAGAHHADDLVVRITRPA